MKRIVPSILLLLFVILTVVSGSIYIDIKIDELSEILNTAYDKCEVGDFAETKKALEDFHKVFERDESILILFVRRNLLNELKTVTHTLSEYASEETKYDFFTETKRALAQLEVIRESQFRLI
ncbi:MAG: DUF4363 family protein [Oscillospiraceae bacterium]